MESERERPWRSTKLEDVLRGVVGIETGELVSSRPGIVVWMDDRVTLVEVRGRFVGAGASEANESPDVDPSPSTSVSYSASKSVSNSPSLEVSARYGRGRYFPFHLPSTTAVDDLLLTTAADDLLLTAAVDEAFPL